MASTITDTKAVTPEFEDTKRLVYDLAWKSYSRIPQHKRHLISFEDLYQEGCTKWAQVVDVWEPTKGKFSTLVYRAVTNHMHSFVEGVLWAGRKDTVSTIVGEDGQETSIFDVIEGGIDAGHLMDKERRVLHMFGIASNEMVDFITRLREDGVDSFKCTTPHDMSPASRKRTEKALVAERHSRLAREAKELRQRTGVSVDDLVDILWR